MDCLELHRPDRRRHKLCGRSGESVCIPSHFAVLDRRNTLDVLKQIAFDCRCALWVSNGVVYLKYLPVEPTADLTITVSDIELGTVEVSTVDTESLVTKMDVSYTTSYAEQDERKIILRNNVGRYGTKQQSYSWLAYTSADLVYHASSFWALRLSTSWKRIRFNGFLPLLQLETFDTVLLNLPGYVASGSVKAVVESAAYDSASNTVRVECLVPVVSGYMVQHPLFWPSAATATYPTIYDQPGGSGLGGLASGTIPIGDISHLRLIANSEVFVGGPNTIFKPRSDWGSAKLFDTGFVASPVVIASSYTGFDPGTPPELDLGIDFLPPPQALELALPSGAVGRTDRLDISKTLLYDPLTQASALLSEVVRTVTTEAGPVLATDVNWSDGTHVGAFDFRYDEQDEEFGAGTAFLEDR